MSKETAPIFYAKSQKHWRAWLEKNHNKKESVWLLCYKKSAKKPTLDWTTSVDEALCFGWIDSVRRSLDDEKFIQFFSRRKPKSIWSKINKAKIKRLSKDGLMRQAGLDAIAVAKKNGSWSAFDAVEKLTLPTELAAAFTKQPAAKKFFDELPRSIKKQLLHWVMTAKREETRDKRINELVMSALENMRPKGFR